ncbi:MAG TPA: hypothetical protein PKW07_11030 [Syntrophorhabdaceae bacterium]|nr:hypothetical protein [Syntrophorhabdaceae bacterium]
MNQRFLIKFLLVFLFIFIPLIVSAQGKPNIISHDAQYLDNAVKITVRWQSPNPVLLVNIFAGNEQKEIKVDEYDNIRNRDGYSGEVSALIKLSSTPATDSISYVVQVQDELRQKSEQAVGKVKIPSTGAILVAQQPVAGVVQQQVGPGIQIGIQQGIQIGAQPAVQPEAQQPAKSGDIVDKLLAVMDRHDTPPFLHDITVNRLGPETVSFSTKAQDDKGLREIKFKVLEATGSQVGEETLSNLGKIWQGTTKTFTLPAGNYRVVAQAFDTGGNSSPEKGANFQISGKAGSLQVNILPKEAADSGAQWKVGTSPWQSSGATMPGIPAGQQTVEFKDITGWAKPANINVNIEHGKTSSISGTYTKQQGSLIVAIIPQEAINAGAQWKVGTSPWQSSGATLSGVPVGQQTVEFKDIPGWGKPGNVQVVIEDSKTATTTGEYQKQFGLLQVTITPQSAIDAGAKWRVDNGEWQSSGATVSNLGVGQHVVDFAEIPGWGKPANQNIMIESGKTVTASGVYAQQFGTIAVVITPQDAINAGGMWRVDNGEWQKIGSVNIAIGSHTIDFKDIPGWVKPRTSTVNVTPGQVSTVNGVYTQQPGSLTVTITPQAAIEAGAKWRVANGEWQASGAMLANIPAGTQNVEFSDVAGWIKQSNLSVQVISGQAATLTGAYGRIYTTDKDFDEGSYVGLEHTTVRDQLQLSKTSTTLPFIWIPNSNEGTISKIDTRTGDELGRYRVSPPNVYGDPSRTTVDLQGNCWVGNRQGGTIVKVGLAENGQCVDRNGNGKIDTSTGGNNVLDWGQDECVLHEVVVIPGKEATYVPGKNPGSYSSSPYPRGVAIDANNNVWASTYNAKRFYYIDGRTGNILKTIDVSSSGHNSYGLVVDSFGILWSSGAGGNNVLRLDPKTGSFTKINLPHYVYGLGLDKANHLFAAGLNWGRLTRINTATGQIEWTKDIGKNPRSIAVTNDGDLWITNYQYGSVTRLSNDGVVKATISVGGEPTGVAVDADGKVWAVNYYDKITRIDPATNKVDIDKQIRGNHYSYSDMTGIIARSMTTRIGTWTVVFDAKSDATKWQGVTWNGTEPQGTSIKVRVRSSKDQKTWSAWEDIVKGGELKITPDGRYLQVETTLQIVSGEVSPVLNDLTVLVKR